METMKTQWLVGNDRVMWWKTIKTQWLVATNTMILLMELAMKRQWMVVRNIWMIGAFCYKLAEWNKMRWWVNHEHVKIVCEMTMRAVMISPSFAEAEWPMETCIYSFISDSSWSCWLQFLALFCDRVLYPRCSLVLLRIACFSLSVWCLWLLFPVHFTKAGHLWSFSRSHDNTVSKRCLTGKSNARTKISTGVTVLTNAIHIQKRLQTLHITWSFDQRNWQAFHSWSRKVSCLCVDFQYHLNDKKKANKWTKLMNRLHFTVKLKVVHMHCLFFLSVSFSSRIVCIKLIVTIITLQELVCEFMDQILVHMHWG